MSGSSSPPDQGSGKPSPRRLRFGGAVLDEGAMELRVDGAHVDVERKALDVLRHLLRNAGQLVTKDDLLEAVWPGRVVTEASLTKAIAKLRTALGPAADRLATVHGYGYRLDGAVQVDETGPSLSEERAVTGMPALGRRNARAAWGAVGAAVLLLAGLWWMAGEIRDAGQAATQDHPEPSVAVLPFSVIGGGEDDRVLSDGLHDAVILSLAKVRDLRVVSRTSVAGLPAQGQRLRDVGEMLGVRYLVEASVQRDGDRLRLTAQLLDAHEDAHVWAESFDRATDDLFALQSELAGRVAGQVRASVSSAARKDLLERPTDNAEAYALFLRARAHWDSSLLWREEHATRVERLLGAAITRDPGFAEAHAMLARSHLFLRWGGADRSPGRLLAAEDAIRRAMELKPESPDVLVANGQFHYHGHRDYARALAALQAALERQPGHHDAKAYVAYVQRRLGQFEQAVETQQAVSEANPGDVRHQWELAYTYMMMRRHAEADQQFERLARRYPERTDLRVMQAATDVFFQGHYARINAVLEDVTGEEAMPLLAGLDAWAEVMVATGRVAEVELLLSKEPEFIHIAGGGGTHNGYPLALDLAMIRLLHDGDAAAARPLFERAQGIQARHVERDPENAFAWMLLATTQAGAGREAEAQAAEQRALELMPMAHDAIAAPRLRDLQVKLRLVLGDVDGALDVMEQQVGHWGGHWTIQAWAASPLARPLHDHPRFKALLAKYGPDSGYDWSTAGPVPASAGG